MKYKQKEIATELLEFVYTLIKFIYLSIYHTIDIMCLLCKGPELYGDNLS